MNIPDRVLKELTLVASVAGSENDWVSIKKQLLLALPAKLRKLFSTRDAKTKRQSLNIFEMHVINEYKELTGIRLELLQDD